MKPLKLNELEYRVDVDRCTDGKWFWIAESKPVRNFSEVMICEKRYYRLEKSAIRAWERYAVKRGVTNWRWV